MMKKIILNVLLLTFLAGAFAQAQSKLAVVDMTRVLKDYYKTKEVEDRLKETANGYQKDFGDRRESYGKLIDQIRTLQEEARDASLSEAKKKEKQTALEQKIKDARSAEQENSNFMRTASGLLQEQRGRATQAIMDEVSKAITSVSKAKGFNLVLAKTEMPSAVLYSDVSDLSDDVLKELNKNQPPAKK